MKNILMALLVTMITVGCGTQPTPDAAHDNTQDIRIFTVANPDKKITTATIEKAFEATGFSIDGNNNMNKPFSKRFGSTWYDTYHLFTCHNADIVAKLVEKYPSIGLLTPLSMSIWSSNDNKSMSISSLSLRGISRVTQIPMDNPDIIALADLLEKALRAALPGGHFEQLKYTKVTDAKQSLSTLFTVEEWEQDEDGSYDTAKDDFEAEFEGEMEPIGFLFPGFIGVNDELTDRGVKAFDFYDTYSVCKLDVIHPISKDHPEVGAFAPCTFYIYKLKSEDTVRMGFPSVDNWINSTDLDLKETMDLPLHGKVTKGYKTFDTLIQAQKLFEDTVNSIIE
jgi:uncharacterized protein (DUF302 family)